MKKGKILLFILIVILVFIIVFGINFMRLNNFLNKVKDNSVVTNFSFEREMQNENGEIWSKAQYMRKDNVVLSIVDDKAKFYWIYNGDNNFTTYTIDVENKTFQENEIITENPYELLPTLSGTLNPNYSFLEKIKMCFSWKIKSDYLDGTKCIVIVDNAGNTNYYDAETAYLLKYEDAKITNIQIENVTDEEVALPDFEEYTKIKEFN